MARFRVKMDVGHPDGGDPRSVTALVDASADHSMLPESLLRKLRIVPRRQLEFVLGDGRVVEYLYGVALFSIDGEEWPCPVLFGPEGRYLLGASALAIFNLEEDRGSERLMPAKWLSLGVRERGESGIDDATLIRPTAVTPLEGYRIWLRYSDGVSGEVDLSGLAGRGVFSAWDDRTFFESVKLDASGAVTWGADIDLCPDALYMQLTGKSEAEVSPSAQALMEDA